MEEAIKAILAKIPKGAMFDTHAVIECLIQEHSDTYLDFYKKGEGTNKHHQNIALILCDFVKAGLIERIGDDDTKIWSMNIRKNITLCTCWKKNKPPGIDLCRASYRNVTGTARPRKGAGFLLQSLV
jgi:hypothetical protein